MEVQNNRADALIAKIAETKVTENAINLVKTLQHDLDIVTIAHLLASVVQEEASVKGKDNIGLGLEEIELLIERAMQNRGGDRGRGGHRRRNSGGRRDTRNRNRNKHGRNGRSGGGRDSRNGGHGSSRS
jgi:ATP-dependent RNA helicase DeaD